MKRRIIALVAVSVLIVATLAIDALIKPRNNFVDIDNEDEIVHAIQELKLDGHQVKLYQKEILGEYCAVIYGIDAKPNWLGISVFKKTPMLNRYDMLSWMEVTDDIYALPLQPYEPLLVVFGKNPNDIYQSYTVEQGNFSFGKTLTEDDEFFLDIYYSNAPDAPPKASFYR